MHWMIGASSVNCLSCRIPHRSLHSLNASPSCSEKELFFTGQSTDNWQKITEKKLPRTVRLNYLASPDPPATCDFPSTRISCFLSVFPFFSRDIRGSVGIENPCFWMVFLCPIIGCTRRGSYSAKGRVSAFKHLLSSFYKTLPSKNPSKNSVFIETLSGTF